MRVCFLAHYPNFYGANKSLLDLAAGLISKGMECLVIIPAKGPLAEELKKQNIPFKIIHFRWCKNRSRSRLKSSVRFLLNLASSVRISFCVLKWKADLVYSNSSVITAGLYAAKLSRRPHVWHLREFGLEDYRLYPDFGEIFFRAHLKKSNGVITNSFALHRHFFSSQPGTGGRYVIYNGVKPRAWFTEQLAASAEKVEGKFIFVLPGLIDPSKGQDFAIKAMSLLLRKHSAAELWLIGGTGDTAYEEKCKLLIEQSGFHHNIFLKPYNSHMDQVYAQSYCGLMCSSNEAMGRVTAEAMAAGLPVIGRCGGATNELISDGVNGFLVPDHEQMAVRMAELIENRAKRNMLGRNALINAAKLFSIEDYVNQVADVLTKVRKTHE